MKPRFQPLFQKLKFDNSGQKKQKKHRKCRYQTCLVLSNIIGFRYFVSNILSGIEDCKVEKNIGQKSLVVY